MAARLLGASDRLLSELGAKRWDPADYENTLSTIRATLGEEAFGAAWRDGFSLDEDEALELALYSLQ